MRRLVAVRACIVSLALGAGLSCGSESNGPGGGVDVAEISINLAADSLLEGATRQIQYALKDANGNILSSQPLTWSSSNPNVASVDGNAVLTAHSSGTSVITGSLSGLSDQISFTVLLPVATVTLIPDTVSLLPGEQQVFQAVTRDQIGNVITGRAITWSNLPAGKVTNVGSTVTAHSPGSVQIRATTVLQPVQGTATVTILDTVAIITVTSGIDSLLAHDTTRATAVSKKASGAILPPQPVVWASSNNAVATVSSSGLITAVGPGQATISATLRNKSGSTLVKVLFPTGSVSVRPNPIIMAAPGTLSVFATVRDTLGGNLTGRTLAWSSSGTGPLVVTPLNNTVAAIRGDANGTHQVTATALLDSTAGSTPIDIGRSISFSTIAGGPFQTCGIATDSFTYCWGGGAFDQVTTDVPTTASGWPTFTSIVAGIAFRCGLTAAGVAYCWGGSGFGEVGNGSNAPAPSPVAVSGGHTFSQLSARGFFVCGISTGGATYCWGQNNRGQLGNNATVGSNVPALVQAPAGVTFVLVSTGIEHACGLTAGGTAFCWGWNDAGRLGIDTVDFANGEATSRLTPVPLNSNLTFSNISAGGSHTCGVATDMTAWCWGYGATGALGNNSAVSAFHPVPVSGGLNFQKVAASRDFTCGIAVGNAAYCWGSNVGGPLGPNGGGGTLTPVTVGLAVTQLTPGQNHTCAIASGTVYCWGSPGNALGQGVLGVPNGSSVPVKVAGQP